MHCRDALPLVLAGLDAPLDAARQRDLDAHLLVCADCVEALREHVLAREAFRDASLATAPEPPLPEAVVRDLVARMRAARAAPPAGGARSA
ncbi:MAG: zf-HC2 domain-containing protein [Planctomycetia bacterium]|nr:zf-HC2 domain-containing protein [Planctomycetia bacterium]